MFDDLIQNAKFYIDLILWFYRVNSAHTLFSFCADQAEKIK